MSCGADDSTADNYGIQTQNANGHYVDLFCPDTEPIPSRLAPYDLDPIPIAGMHWLIDTPKIEETVAL